jgi:transcriptional regulator with XRE-family HTH domain
MFDMSDIKRESGRPVPFRIVASSRDLGENLRTWRKLNNFTAAELAEKSGISRALVSKIESGDSSVKFESVLRVINALQLLEPIIDATDPYLTDLGRARAGMKLPQRIRS